MSNLSMMECSSRKLPFNGSRKLTPEDSCGISNKRDFRFHAIACSRHLYKNFTCLLPSIITVIFVYSFSIRSCLLRLFFIPYSVLSITLPLFRSVNHRMQFPNLFVIIKPAQMNNFLMYKLLVYIYCPPSTLLFVDWTKLPNIMFTWSQMVFKTLRLAFFLCVTRSNDINYIYLYSKLLIIQGWLVVDGDTLFFPN